MLTSAVSVDGDCKRHKGPVFLASCYAVGTDGRNDDFIHAEALLSASSRRRLDPTCPFEPTRRISATSRIASSDSNPFFDPR